MEHLNVVIVGGGMVGLATALALSQAGFSDIALIEQKPFPVINHDAQSPISTRVSAITPASVNFLKNIAVWSDLSQTRMGTIDAMQVWEQYDKPMMFTSASARVPALGYIVENDMLVAALSERVRECEHIQLILENPLTALTRTSQGILLDFDNGQQICANLVIAADGATSWVRKQLNIDIHVLDYQQHAIVANIATELPHQYIARQRFEATSTCAFLPLADLHQVSLVWSVDTPMTDPLLALAPSVFTERLAERMDHCLGQLTLLNDRQHFPLISRRAVHYTEAHVALVGDAARSVHPLAGQGVNLGFMDASLLVDTLKIAKKQARQIADAYILKRYERAAKANAKQFLTVIDGLYHLFKINNPVVNRIRQAGFQSVARFEPALAWLMQQTMR